VAIIFKKIDKLLHLSNSLTDCHEIWHDDAQWVNGPIDYMAIEKFKFKKIQNDGWPSC